MNRSSEKDYGNLTDAIQFAFNQMMKNIFVSLPGIINTYDPEKKRCRVTPAINIRLTNGDTDIPSAIINVPVLWPSGGGFSLLSPLPEGSPVSILFSQRGITRFKETFSQEDPGNGMFDKEDAYVIPGYGGLSVSPASLNGISMQTEDGSDYIFVEDGNIKVNSTGPVNIISATSVNVTSTDVAINASSSITMTSPDNKVIGPLDVSGPITAPELSAGGTSYTSHVHAQGPDSRGDTEEDTGVPI